MSVGDVIRMEDGQVSGSSLRSRIRADIAGEQKWSWPEVKFSNS
jgi:hypothetical protein